MIMTNGCFDVLHAGHVKFLTQIKGRYPSHELFVAVNTDASISKLKGPTRPIFSLKERMYMLNALTVVDYVVPFDTEAGLEAIIIDLRPFRLCKGKEYRGKPITGSKYTTLDLDWEFTNGRSSTEVITELTKNRV